MNNISLGVFHGDKLCLMPSWSSPLLLCRSGLTGEVLGSLPMAPLPHVWATKRTNVARDHHVDVTDAWPLRAAAPDEVPSVVYCRWLEGNCMPKSPWLIATRSVH